MQRQAASQSESQGMGSAVFCLCIHVCVYRVCAVYVNVTGSLLIYCKYAGLQNWKPFLFCIFFIARSKWWRVYICSSDTCACYRSHRVSVWYIDYLDAVDQRDLSHSETDGTRCEADGKTVWTASAELNVIASESCRLNRRIVQTIQSIRIRRQRIFWLYYNWTRFQ